ncbi:MAG TPA: hypothetical protein DEF47_16695 [Herpetosiphon sp.]|nr:hypothetical protein [Herpetosiphon sp.]
MVTQIIKANEEGRGFRGQGSAGSGQQLWGTTKALVQFVQFVAKHSIFASFAVAALLRAVAWPLMVQDWAI